jgi:hypothetical protein
MNEPVTPPDKFDPTDAEELQATASAKLLQMLKVKRSVKKSSSTREFAVRCVRGLEATIHQLFDAGANTQEVLSQLIEALPSIPADDLRYALRAIGGRTKRLRIHAQTTPPANPGVSDQNRTQEAKSDAPKETKPKSQQRAEAPVTPIATSDIPDLPAWADGSDKRADESDDDYRLRKEIEGPPEARHKFIGEHKT